MNTASKKKLSSVLQIVASVLLFAGALLVGAERFEPNGFVVSALGLGILIGGLIQYYAQQGSGESAATRC
jgi:predicted phage tail protein